MGRRPLRGACCDLLGLSWLVSKAPLVTLSQKTVLFFNPPPSVADVLLAPLRVLGLAPPQQSAAAALTTGRALSATRLDGTPVSARRRDLTLVVGANGGVGARITRLLLAQGRPVRALVRSLSAAKDALGAADAKHPGLLEVVLGDVSQAQTLGGTALGDGVTAVVTCHAARVQPKEGDTPDRSKYKQGIQFYDPEVVESPQAVELGGMQALLSTIAPNLRDAGMASGPPVVLLDGNDVASTQQFGCLDDGVMGGVSVSELVAETIPVGTPATPSAPAAVALFRGTVSAANSGGFASVRNRNFEPPKDCSAATGIAVRCFGDGQRYKLFLRTDAGWDAIAYGVSFDTVAGQWSTIRLPFASFRAIFRARTIRDAAPLDAKSIRSVQIMLSKFEYDGELNPNFRCGAQLLESHRRVLTISCAPVLLSGPGQFRLPIAYIQTYTEAKAAAPATQRLTGPMWVHVSSAGVTRPSRPGIDVTQEPPAVRMNAMLGNLLDYKLAAEDALRGSGVPFAILRPVALTEEPPGMPLEVDQGDVVKGKVSRDDVAQLCVAMLTGAAGRSCIDTTFEVKSSVPFSQPWTEADADAAGRGAQRDWPALLAGLKPGVTGRTVKGVYTGRNIESASMK